VGEIPRLGAAWSARLDSARQGSARLSKTPRRLRLCDEGQHEPARLGETLRWLRLGTRCGLEPARLGEASVWLGSACGDDGRPGGALAKKKQKTKKS